MVKKYHILFLCMLLCAFAINPGKSYNFKHLRTALLVHSDTTDESTTFIDYGNSRHSLTANGSAQHDTAQYKFGKSSILIPSDTDYIEIPYSEDFIFGTGNFTIDFWIRRDLNWKTNYNITWWVDDDNFNTAHWEGEYFGFYMEKTGDTIYNFTYDTNIPSDEWHHVAIIRGWGGNANTLAICYDGTALGTPTFNYDLDNYPGGTPVLRIGNRSGLAAQWWIDEIRISKGVARWISNFTPPSKMY